MKKKTRLQFFFQNVKKKSENVLNYEKVDWNFHQKSEQKTICHNFLEGSAPYTAVFVRDFVSKHLTGPCASNKLVLEYCLLTFLNPDRFLYFRHFFCYNLINIAQASYSWFQPSTDFLSIVKEKKNLFEIFPYPKNFNIENTRNIFWKS